ncbi:MAG: hypothetical protein ABIF01_03855, partial [Candidatus Micrarchaeota archaeon]
VTVLFNTDQSNPPQNFDMSEGVVTINRAVIIPMDQVSLQGRQYGRYIAAYPEVWYDGQSGLADKKGEAYDSNFYKGFFLGRIDGFELVYPEDDPGGLQISTVRIFKIKQ